MTRLPHPPRGYLGETVQGLPQSSVRLTLDWPPTGNHYKRHVCTVGRHRVSAYLTDEARAYKANVADRALEAGLSPLRGAVRIVVALFRPRAAGDIDNSLKVLFDSLQGCAFESDAQIRELHVYLRDDEKGDARAEVRVEQI